MLGLAANSLTPYATNWAHLSDELKRLDLLIHLSVLKQQNHEPASPLDQFKGLAISKEEVDRLLTDTAGEEINEKVIAPADAKAHMLAESLSRLDSQIQQRRAISLKAGVYLSLPRLANLFHL